MLIWGESKVIIFYVFTFEMQLYSMKYTSKCGFLNFNLIELCPFVVSINENVHYICEIYL